MKKTEMIDNKQLKNGLLHGEKRLYSLIETIGDLLWEVDVNNIYTYVSPNIKNILGYEPGEIIGKTPFDIMPKEECIRVYELFHDIHINRKKFAFLENICIHKDGHLVTIETSGVPVFDMDGMFRGYQGIDRDITNRRKAEIALSVEKEQLSVTLRSIGDGVITTDTEGQIVLLNKVAEEMTGWQQEEAMGKPLAEVFNIINEKTRQPCENPVEKVLKENKIIELANHTVLIAKNGTERILADSAAPIRGYDDEITGAVLVFRDVTEKKQAEEVLIESEEKYRSIMESIPNCVYICSPDFRVEYMNFAMIKRVGHDASGEFCYKAINALDEKCPWCVHDKIQKGESCSIVIKSSQDNRNYHVSSSPIFHSDGSISKMTIYTDITDQKKTENALIESESRQRTILDFLETGIVVIDPEEHRIVDANPAALKMIGSYREDVLGRKCHQFICPTREGQCPLSVLGQKIDNVEYELITADGKTIPIIKTVVPVMLVGRKHYLESFVDITRLKRAESVLRASEEMLKLIINNIPQAVFWKDRKSIFLGCNRAMAEIVGLRDPNDIVGMSDYDLSLTKEEANSYRECDQRVMSSDTAELGIEERFHRSDGFEAFLITNKIPLHDAEDNVMGILGTFQDVTNIKQSEEDRIRLSTAIEQSDEIVVVTDINGDIQYANPAFARVTGYEPEEALGQNPRILQGGRHETSFYENLWDTISKGKIWKGHFTNKRKDGTFYDEEATISPVKNKDGKIINYVAVKRDVTHQLKLEANLKQAQKMESIGTLAGGIAHDFNNILGVVLGYAELSLLDIAEESPVHKNVNQIFKAATRAKDLVNQILTFSRQTDQEKKPVKIIPAVKEALKFLRASLPKTIEIRQNLKADFDVVLTDPTQIHQVIMNLCTNAGHAMKESGGVLEVNLSELTLRAEDLPAGSDLTPGLSYLELTISDTGTGISTENLERIFDPYFTTKKTGEGTGLGLSVVHGIVRDMKGKITVSSKMGKGTAFRVLLPLAVTDNDKSKEEPLLLPTGNESILFVDDEQVLVEIGKQMLEGLGYKVEARTSSVEALEAFRHQPEKYDLIITDKTMPNMTGFQLTEKLFEIRPDLPVILCTGFNEVADTEKAKNMGIREMVMKPVVRREIAEAIRRVLGNKA